MYHASSLRHRRWAGGDCRSSGLGSKDVNLILPYVRETGTAEVKSAFEKVARARQANLEAREVADLYLSKRSCGSIAPRS
jgi:hypothetical protein